MTEDNRMPNFWWCPTHHLYRGGDKRPCADAVRLMPAPPAPQPDEVFEIWDKVSQGRAIDLVFPTAVAAFAWLEPNVRPERKGTRKPGDEDTYRVQSVRMWRASEERAIPEPTEGQNPVSKPPRVCTDRPPTDPKGQS